MITDRGAPGGAGPEDPGGAWAQPRCQEWRCAGVDQLAGDKQRWRRRVHADLVPP